jgi:hypothetical protein
VPEMSETILQYALRAQVARNGITQSSDAAILKAVCSVDLDPERREQLLAALRREGVLLS